MPRISLALELASLATKRAHDLTTGERKKLPKKDFVRPSKGKAESGSYPIPDKQHARAALGFAKMWHPHSAILAKVRAKVHKKYPDMA